MKVKYSRISAPLKKESEKLRLIIITGILAMFFFLYTFFDSGVKGYPPLYICLCITLFYTCFKYLHEWYHYLNISSPPVLHETENYTVDILTTFCAGEPYDMLEDTLKAISEIRYPHTGWCCDEADDPLVREMCLRYGIKHITRTVKKDAKAGNINNALQHATGTICVVLDPDHVPAPEFLDIVLPYFKDPEIGYVQVVQAYKNHGESLIAKGAAQQTYQFYGPMMMSMHGYGTAQAIGANCTFRRAALDSIGGHAAGLAEDMHTAMQLHSKGWKSIYVPAVISRGLVPSTLEAYYKQQLKWSRGTFDLLFYSYPKLFKGFTPFQKVHYFLLPLHYLSGLITLLNFMIPVFSLFFAESPLYMDFTSFLIALFPLLCISLLVRHYVQKWVVEETERGFHIVGGLLQIGTWWIHLTGFIYTIFRKKVPYIPTPKNDNDPTPLRLHIPNLSVIAISLLAIIYGLNRDWTPYSLFMAGFAVVNILVLTFVIYASYRRASYLKVSLFFKAKKNLWLFRHWFYRSVRENALILSCIIVTGTINAYQEINEVNEYKYEPLPKERTFYHGLFQPVTNNGITSLRSIYPVNKDSLQIISFYLAWDDSSLHHLLPVKEMEEVYRNNSIPMLTLEPWLSRKEVFRQITEGCFDAGINSLAKQFASINKPVFLRFAHEPENPRYPWSSSGGNSSQSFIAAWRYLHDKFIAAGADKVLWVYNPWKPESADEYFPGSEYVDWLGVDILNYNKQNHSESFEELYRPFHNTAVFQKGLPVLLAETGSLGENKEKWWDATWKVMDTAFSEIRGVVAFNNDFDHYGVNGYQEEPLKWSLPVRSAFHSALPPSLLNTDLWNDTLHVYPEHTEVAKQLPVQMRAVIYDKGYHWFRNIHTASERVLQMDFAALKELKINTIFRTIPGIYDKNIFKMCRSNNINIIPMLWADLDIKTIKDNEYLNKEKHRLLNIIKDFKDNSSVAAWNISNDVLGKMETSFWAPDLFYYKVRYLKWLQELVTEIKSIDPSHPVTLNISLDHYTTTRIKDYQTYIGKVDQFLVNGESLNKKLAMSIVPAGKVAWGIVEPALWDFLSGNKKFIVPNWQDQDASGYVSLNGLFDLQGRKKQSYFTVLKYWMPEVQTKRSVIPDYKILRPARLALPGTMLTYYTLIKDSLNQWEFAKEEPNTTYEWYLVRTDQYGNSLYMNFAGNGVYKTIIAPKHPETYRLYFKVIKGNQVKGSLITLNMPLN